MKTTSILFTMAAIAIGAHAVPVQTATFSSKDIPTSTPSVVEEQTTATDSLAVPTTTATATDYPADDVFVSKEGEEVSTTETESATATASYTETEVAPTVSELASVTESADYTESATETTPVSDYGYPTESVTESYTTATATYSTETAAPTSKGSSPGNPYGADYDNSKTANNNEIVYFKTSDTFDGPFCNIDGPSMSIKWCIPRHPKFTHDQVKSQLDASGNGRCNNFELPTKAIEILKFEPKCKMVAYSAPNCSGGNQWDLGSIGKLSVQEGFQSWKFVCPYL